MRICHAGNQAASQSTVSQSCHVQRVWIESVGIARIPHLAALLGGDMIVQRRPLLFGTAGAMQHDAGFVVGWGCRPSGIRATERARRNGLRALLLEDGFLRSVGLGVHGHIAPLSLVIDDLGIYYDATRPSRLERLITDCAGDNALLAEARRGIARIRAERLSKYNHAPMAKAIVNHDRVRVLLIDQTAGDMSVVLGGASAQTFADMLAAAEIEFPDAEIWIKTHPDVLSGKKRGYLDARHAGGRLRILADDCCPLSLLEQFDRVYVVTSQMGFEALMLGKPVTVFGRPWYAGWGLTDDRHPDIDALRERRPGPRSIEQLFAAAYLQYSRYIKPISGAPGTLVDVMDWIVRNKTINDESRGTYWCVGMSLWKRAIVAPFLETPASRVRFVRSIRHDQLSILPPDARLVVWGNRHVELCAAAAARGIPVVRLEDAFLRSTGLGSDLHGPLSLAVDGPGIYYDPFSGSRMEQLLATVQLDAASRTRAARLRETLVRQKVSKYNVGGSFTLSPASTGRRVLLVPGQVEDDASILAGSPFVRRNVDLLRNVRKANPNAWIVYKPHPDVVAGNRLGGIAADELAELANQVVEKANVSECIAAADEVHTMTSLTGFEALLFGKTVHCYGGPFYAGWGLTVDHMELLHRRRRLSMDELVYVALCQYPRYRLPGVVGFCAAEDVVDFLITARERSTATGGSHWISRQWRKGRQLVRVIVGAR
ncbi:capsular polysaccharide biosynthesis protein [Cupriavidus sp. DF5525]|uniref:capsular polysaccharide biosynthesis protein n=1 Tax=Cupriavidus sp. DF5525 TaxID=3160989 RepID=UPI0026AFE5A5